MLPLVPAWSSEALSKHMVTSSTLSGAFSASCRRSTSRRSVSSTGGMVALHNNKRGAICCRLCCGEQLDQKCNDFSGERACPTVVDAVRFLRAKVENCHGVGRCISFEFFCD